MVARILLFCSSYVPLFVIFAIRFPDTAKIWWIVAGVFAACALLVLHLVRTKHEPQFYPVASIDDNAAAAAYMASYILPFVTISDPNGRDFAAYAVFFVVLAVVYTRSSLVGVNPLVYITRMRIYQIKTSKGESYVLFARTRPNSGDEICASRAFSGLLVRRDQDD